MRFHRGSKIRSSRLANWPNRPNRLAGSSMAFGPKNPPGVTAGPKKSFKSWGLHSMAIALASGKPYLDKFEPYKSIDIPVRLSLDPLSELAAAGCRNEESAF